MEKAMNSFLFGQASVSVCAIIYIWKQNATLNLFLLKVLNKKKTSRE